MTKGGDALASRKWGELMKQGYLFRRKGVWQLRRMVNGKRKTVSLRVSTKPEAEKVRQRILAEDAAVTAERGRISSGIAWGIFRDSLCRRECSRSTLAGYEAQWLRFIGTLTDSLDLGSLTRERVSDYLRALKDHVGCSTWNKHLNCLKYVWKTIQIETGATLPDVFLGVQPLSVPLVRHEAFTTDQIQRLYDAADGELRDIVGFCSHTGLRRVDCLNFEKRSYDAVTGLLRLMPRKTARISAQALIAPSSLVSDVLARRNDTASPYLFPEAASLYSACPQTWGVRFQRFMVKTLELNGDSGLYGMHSFRHWFKSELTDKNVPGAVIDVMMCHGQGKVGARYVHPSLDVMKGAVDQLTDFR